MDAAESKDSINIIGFAKGLNDPNSLLRGCCAELLLLQEFVYRLKGQQ